jgi:hypothetical protein
MNQIKLKSNFRRIAVLLFGIALFSCNSQVKTNVEQPAEDEYYVAAYIWPSCHHDERFGDMLWPEGSGEWEIIKKGTPRFERHYQPKVPLWGYEMDDDPEVMEKWIDAAAVSYPAKKMKEIQSQIFYLLSAMTNRMCIPVLLAVSLLILLLSIKLQKKVIIINT